MSVKLIAIDVDNTLINSPCEHEASQGDAEAIRCAQRAGIRVVLNTGRPYSNVVPLIRALKLEAPGIFNNGALICDGEKVYFQRTFPEGVPAVFLNFAEREKCTVSFLTESGNYVATTDGSPLDSKCFEDVDQSMLITFDTLRQKEYGCLLKAAFPFPRTAGLDERVDCFRRYVADYFDIGLLEFAPARQWNCLDITPRNCNKGSALEEYCRLFGFSREETMMIGDDNNDVSALAWAGLGVAVENATAEAKKAADRLVPSVEDNGVACAIQRFALAE